MRIALVAGARPNFMKVAPLFAEMARRPALRALLVHTGQHHDPELSARFLEDLGLPDPVVNFGVGSASAVEQVAGIMAAFEPWARAAAPDLVVVVGDVTSTLAAALAASKMDLPVAHVEAGLRSGDRTMPEEVNRIVVDQLSDLLFVTEPAGVENLRREGVDAARVHLVGNLMIDSLMRHRERARGRDVRARLGLPPGAHAVLTLHRPATVDVRAALQGVLQAVAGIAAEVRVVFPVHPRTRRRLAEMGLEALLRAPGIVATEPLSYLDFLGLLETARVVLTDSGGIQEEATVLGVPCLTLRESTERPITVSEGTNRIVGTDPEAIAGAWREVLAVGPMAPRRPALWDGRAAARIVDVVEAWRRP